MNMKQKQDLSLLSAVVGVLFAVAPFSLMVATEAPLWATVGVTFTNWNIVYFGIYIQGLLK